MTRDELLKIHSDLCFSARELMKKKNADYAGRGGNEPFANFTRTEAMGVTTTERGILVRMVDKMSRLSSFMESGEFKVDDEKLEDTILDMINYSILLYAYIQDKNKVDEYKVEKDYKKDYEKDYKKDYEKDYKKEYNEKDYKKDNEKDYKKDYKKEYNEKRYKVKIVNLPNNFQYSEIAEFVKDWGYILKINTKNFDTSSIAVVEFKYEREADYFIEALDNTPFEHFILKVTKIEE